MIETTAFRQLEELTLSTSPAIHHGFCDGWILRASGGDVKRANSASLLGHSTQNVEANLGQIESWYGRHHQPAMFRLTHEAGSAGVDDFLAQRGYVRAVETAVMTLSLREHKFDHDAQRPDVRVRQRSLADWSREMHGLKGSVNALLEADIQRQSLWIGTQVFLSLNTINGLTTTGMARIEGSFAGIFSMRTAESARGKGFGTMLLRRLLAWSCEQGAATAFLQVDVENAPAMSLYRRFGFETQYHYWHRVASQR